MTIRVSRTIYRMKLGTALVMVLPLLLGSLWLAWSAYTRFERYRRAADAGIALDLELYQIFLHDEVTRQLVRLVQAEPPARSRLDLIEVFVDRTDLEVFERNEGKRRGYVEAIVRSEGGPRRASVRPQGRRHWNVVGSQKSMKVRVEGDSLFGGIRVFNLLNDPTPFGLEEKIILDLARERGLLAAELRPVRLQLNNMNAGIFLLEPQPDEALLRRQRRMPGSLYSGVFDGTCNAANGPPCGWRTFGARSPDEVENHAALKVLLEGIASKSHGDFAELARTHLDLSRFALFDALDVVFGGDQHDLVSNHKLYYDAYRGRFEPIARDFRAFSSDPMVKPADSALSTRLAMLPEFRWMRDREVYRLVTHDASLPAIRERVEAERGRMRADLAADPHWDAYKLLPRASKFHRQMVRPMTAERWALATEAELSTYARRSRFLVDTFEAPSIALSGFSGPRGLGLEAIAEGYGAHRIRAVRVVGAGPGTFRMVAEVSLDGSGAAEDAVVARGDYHSSVDVTGHDLLLPGVEIAGRDRERLTLRRVPERYRYRLAFNGSQPRGAWLSLTNLVTGSSRQEYVAFEATEPRVPAAESVEVIPSLQPGERSPHPWWFAPKPPAELITLGPGLVSLPVGRRYSPRTTVVVRAGTEIVLGPKASLVFEGRVRMEGQIDRPVRIRGEGSAHPGGVLLLGPATAGSRISHLEVVGASQPRLPLLFTPGAVGIHDTEDVTLEAVTIKNTRGADDALHATYVAKLTLKDVTIEGASGDAVDLEYTSATLRGLRVSQARGECLDTMGSVVRVSESLLSSCSDNAVSVGERSDVTLHGSIIAGAETAVLAKNASTVRVAHTVIFGAERALATNRRDRYYVGASSIHAQDVSVVKCNTTRHRAKKTRIEVDGLSTVFPETRRWRARARYLLGTTSWSQLPSRARSVAVGEPP